MSITFKEYIERVNTPLTFFTINHELTPYSMFMAYFNYAYLWYPQSSPTQFQDLLVECSVVHAYYLTNQARFMKQQREGWKTHYTPSVIDDARKISDNINLKQNIDRLVKDWFKLCDEHLYWQLYTMRNNDVSHRNAAYRVFSCTLALALTVLIIFSIAYATRSLAPAFIAPAAMVGLFLCFALSQSFKPLKAAADLMNNQASQPSSFIEKYDQSEKVFERKRAVVDSFSQGDTSYSLNEAFAEKVIALSYPAIFPPQAERSSTKKAILFLAQDMLSQRYENKYTDYEWYCRGDKEQRLDPAAEGPVAYDFFKHRQR